MKRVLAALVLTTLGAAQPAWAHPVPFSYLDLHVDRGAIEATLVAHIFDLGHDLGIEPADQLLVPRVAAERTPAIAALLGPRLHVEADGRTLVAEWSSADPVPDRQAVRMHL